MFSFILIEVVYSSQNGKLEFAINAYENLKKKETQVNDLINNTVKHSANIGLTRNNA